MEIQSRYRVAVAQLKPAPTKQDALNKVERSAAEAADQQARIVLFPESYIGGYPRGSSFGTTVGFRSGEGREEFRKYWENAIDIPGNECDQIAQIAKYYRVQIVVGVVERDGGTLYCTVLFFSAEGQFLGRHRKLMPTGSERLIWGFGDGSTMPVFDTPLGKVGALICWENYMPLMRTAHYAKGIELYCAPTADGRDAWLSTMRHIALEGRCFVLSSNQFAHKSDYPQIYSLSNQESDSIISTGGSCIIDPFGEVLNGPDFEGEVVLTAEVDRGKLPRAKYDFDVVGHYARADIFSLYVNTNENKSVHFNNSDE